MASFYWVKLYHEILNDAKMGNLSDRLYRRAIELELLAGKTKEDGFLPELEQIAFELRVSEEHLEPDLAELEKTGIVQQLEGRWHVTNFSKRQAKVDDAERVRKHRERKKKEQYYGSNESETNRNRETDTETEQDTDTEIEQQQKDVDVILEKCKLSHSQIQKLKNEQSTEEIHEAVRVYEQGKKLGKVNGPGYIVDYFRYGWKPADWYVPDPDSEKELKKYRIGWEKL